MVLLEVLDELTLVGPQNRVGQQPQVATCRDKIENVNLIGEAFEDFIMRLVSSGSELVPFRALKAATALRHSHIEQVLPIAEEVLFANFDARQDFLFVVFFLDAGVTEPPVVASVELSGKRRLIGKALEITGKEGDDSPDGSYVAANECKRLVKAQQGNFARLNCGGLGKCKRVDAV